MITDESQDAEYPANKIHQVPKLISREQMAEHDGKAFTKIAGHNQGLHSYDWEIVFTYIYKWIHC